MIETKQPDQDEATGDVLEELDRRAEELNEWHEKASDYSRQTMAARAERNELEGQLGKLIRNNPLLIDGDDQPVARGNPVAKLRAQLAKVPDPDAIARRKDHAERVKTKLGQDLEAFVLEHFQAIHAARYPQAVEVRDQLARHREAYLEATERYLEFARATVGLAAPHPDYNGRDVAGINEGGELLRVLEEVENLPLPTIHGTGPEVGTKRAFLVERPTEDEGDQ